MTFPQRELLLHKYFSLKILLFFYFLAPKSFQHFFHMNYECICYAYFPFAFLTSGQSVEIQLNSLLGCMKSYKWLTFKRLF